MAKRRGKSRKKKSKSCALSSTDSKHIGYCVKCRTKRKMVGARTTVLRNGRRALKGNCCICGTGMTRFIK